MAKYVPHRYSKSVENTEQIGAYMSAPVLSIDSDTSIKDTVQFMESKNVGSLLVKKKEDYVGIVTERDLTRKVLGMGLDPAATTVESIMTTPILSLEAAEPVEDANKYMAKHGIRHLGVTEDGKIVGLLSVRDLVSFYANPRLRLQ